MFEPLGERQELTFLEATKTIMKWLIMPVPGWKLKNKPIGRYTGWVPCQSKTDHGSPLSELSYWPLCHSEKRTSALATCLIFCATTLLAVLAQARHAATTGPLHWPLLWPETLFLRCPHGPVSLPSSLCSSGSWSTYQGGFYSSSHILIKYESHPLILYSLYLDLFFL